MNLLRLRPVPNGPSVADRVDASIDSIRATTVELKEILARITEKPPNGKCGDMSIATPSEKLT